jgi:cell division protein FtsW
MKDFKAEKMLSGNKPDDVLVVSVLLLTVLGLVTLYSASWGFCTNWYKGDGYYLLRKQLIFAGIGLVLFFLCMKLPIEKFRATASLFVLAAIALCLLVFLPVVGYGRNGADRWIKVAGITYQPSEFVKLALPLYLAHIFSKKADKLDTLRGIAPQMGIVMLFFILIYRQNNFSTAIFIVCVSLVIFFLAGVKLSYFASAVILMLPISAFMVFTKEHRLRRVMSFFWPDWEPMGASFQVNAARDTIAAGGLWGKGLGQGTRKIASVPEISNDFVFSAFAEEGGFIAVALFVLLWGVFLWRAYKAAFKQEDNFRRLLIIGLATTLGAQALVNVAVVAGCLPATGVPLPFFSSGGSSLATTLAMCGLLVNAARPQTLDIANEENDAATFCTTPVFLNNWRESRV